jgi:NAD(P)-dependent dehydrogenase (short-subunit alcohol dehydrogenase family)
MNEPSHLFVLTGASRGLGRALLARVLRAGHLVLTLSRHPDTATAVPKGAALEQWAVDLADPQPAARRLEDWLATQPAATFKTVSLLNNAGLLGPVGPLQQTAQADLAAALRVDLEAPLLLTAAFLRATAGWPGLRRVLSVSSGAGRRPIEGWSVYCAAKAGLDHMTRVAALEQARLPGGARLCSLAPGIIDTDMQCTLRAADEAGFPDKPRFVELHERGQLVSPEDAAQRILDYLDRPDFGSEPVDDLRR